jgi:hypothetical protein
MQTPIAANSALLATRYARQNRCADDLDEKRGADK